MCENNSQEMAQEAVTAQNQTADTSSNVINSSKSPVMLSIEKIIPDPNQSRKEFNLKNISTLAESIKLHGLITPIVVIDVEDQDGKYKIVDGERRYRAINELIEKDPEDPKYKSVPVSFIGKDDPIYGILANMAHQTYNTMEYAEALEHMKNKGQYSDKQLGRLVGKARSSIS